MQGVRKRHGDAGSDERTLRCGFMEIREDCLERLRCFPSRATTRVIFVAKYWSVKTALLPRISWL